MNPPSPNPPASELSSNPYDLCIIGCGAMGIALAVSLADSGKRILILEAGTDDITDASQAFYQSESIGHPHIGSSNGRFRVYGGSTERWGGQAMRFEPLDFQARPWLNADAWPVSLDEIVPYYSAAEAFMGIPSPPYDALPAQLDEFASKLGLSPGILKEPFAPFKLHHSIFSKTPRLREMLTPLLPDHPGITLLKNVAVMRVVTDSNGTITHLGCRSGETEIQVRAGEFILASGGIENARFLLLQKDYYQVPELAAHRAIGCFFQDHPGAHVAEISGVGAALFQNAFRQKRTEFLSYKGRITWSDESRRLKEFPSVTGTFLMSPQPSPFDDVTSDPGNAISPKDWRLALKLLWKRVLYSPLHYTILAVSAEDVRDRASRILLSEHKQDAFGQPHAVIDWKISPKVPESIMAYISLMETIYSDLRLGGFRRFSIARDPALLMSRLEDNSHHVGSTSMGTSVENGVVDNNCKVFGFSNLRIAGNSVLPTGSHANPTLTGLALAFRMANQIRSSH
jgi:choline dehydrogenase-like flavoprotein